MRIWNLFVVMVGCCGVLQAAPLDLRQVSGDAKWLVHLDVDAMRESSLMENAYLAGSRQWAELEEWMATACEEVGVDPRVDLHGITLFGKKLGKLDGVALVSAKMQPDTLVARAKAESGYKSSKYGDYEIHSWTDGEETVTGAFYQPSLLVVARTDKEVEHALDVLNGKAPSLTGRERAVAGDNQAGTMFLAWAEGLADSTLPFHSPAIKKGEAVGLVVGESKGQVFAALRLVMRTPDTARRVLDVLNGLRAAAELQYEGHSSMMHVVERLRFSLAEKVVSAELRAPAEDVWLQIKRVFAAGKGNTPGLASDE